MGQEDSLEPKEWVKRTENKRMAICTPVRCGRV